MKKCFDKHKVGHKNFEVGDMVLKWDRFNEPKGKNIKFQNLWLGRYHVAEKIGVGTYRLQSLEGDFDSLLINEYILKRYFT
jgi:hypothetical protein